MADVGRLELGGWATRMDQVQVHYELFVRKTPGAPWSLEMAGENRAQVV